MAYNTGRNNDGLSNLGQRRGPHISNNFIAGGQLTSHNPRPGSQSSLGYPTTTTTSNMRVSTSNQQSQQQTQESTVSSVRAEQLKKTLSIVLPRLPPQNSATQRQQTATQQRQGSVQQRQVPTQQRQVPIQQQQVATSQVPTQKIPVQQQHQPQEQPVSQNQVHIQPKESQINESKDDVTMSTVDDKKTRVWLNKGKITRKERQRRRNVRLAKILQPKNAVMILNELVKNSTYTVTDLITGTDCNQYKAIVVCEDTEHVGYGKSKMEAKNEAAENALKYLVTKRKVTDFNKTEDNDEKMDVSENSSVPLPWQHVASFALFKLLNSWGEEISQPIKTVGLLQEQISTPMAVDPPQQLLHNKPAKKMPDHPEQINPLMLMNQMLPQAQFEEIGKSGDAPNIIFSVKCTVDDKCFTGSGPSKKAARKAAAFWVCSTVLGIKYPTEFWEPKAEPMYCQ